MRRAVVGLALSAAMVGVVACGGSDSGDSASSGSSTAAKSGDANKHVNIAHFVAIQANPVEQVIIKSAKDTGKANNATVTTFDSNNDVQRELANCQDAIASKKYDAFVLKAVSGPPLIPCAVATEKVVADLKKDKIITVGAGGSKVGVDAIKAGKQFGDTVILPATEAKAATLMAIKAARKQDVGDTTIDVTKDLSPVGTIVDASNVDKYQPEW
jgi:ABC-type sugar transport system substrate-binding protein